jgi:hypothetical protein
MRDVVYAKKNENGLVVDKFGKCIFLWEYVKLDGTIQKPLSDSLGESKQ